jgi:hypothetical protein
MSSLYFYYFSLPVSQASFVTIFVRFPEALQSLKQVVCSNGLILPKYHFHSVGCPIYGALLYAEIFSTDLPESQTAIKKTAFGRVSDPDPYPH